MKRNTIKIALVVLIILGVLVGASMLVPRECVLCDVEQYANICLINLHTGEIEELEVYDVGRLYENGKVLDTREFSNRQTFGTFNFVNCAGLTGYRTTGTHNTYEMDVPDKVQRISRKHYCSDCYKQLVAVSNKGYLILDSYNPEDKQIYSMNEGDHHLIRVFDVSVIAAEEKLTLKVIGTMEIEEGEHGQGGFVVN